jgi:Omp85 superfamily domain
MKYVVIAFTLLICAVTQVSLCAAQPCEVLKNDAGQQRSNGSRLCVTFKVTGGALDIDRSQSTFVASDEFLRRLSISPAEAEDAVFAALAGVLKTIPKPYRFALSDDDRARDDRGELNDDKTNAIRTANANWTAYLEQYNVWATGPNRRSMPDVFSTFEADALTLLVNAQDTTALLVWEDGSFDASSGTFKFSVTDPINNWADETQVKISFPDLPDGSKKDSRRKRLTEILRPLSGRPRCFDCIKRALETFYQRMGLDPELSFDGRNTSPLLIAIIESKRIVSISWQSLEDNDPNVDKLLYSLMTDQAFRRFVKQRASIGKVFNYRRQTGQPGPYLNAQRMQIQQLLVTQLGYAVSLTLAPGEPGTNSSFNITIQKLSDSDEPEDGAATPPPTTNATPEPAAPTANPEGIVTAHDQEKKAATDFKPEAVKDKPKDKKRYVGGGFEFLPGQGVKFFGLGQISRFPLLPGSVNNFSVKVGGQGTDGALGTGNYFADYVLFNRLHRRVSIQFTVSSDLEANRNLTVPDTDERQRAGFGRLEFEPFRDRSGSLLRFFLEGRHETVELTPDLLPSVKNNLSTVEVGAFYFFQSVEVERPRRIRFEPKFKFGLGLAVGEPRYNKLLTTGSFHQMLPRRFEVDISGRVELASHETPEFELPSFGGSEVLRGFRRDDGLGRKLWSLQNEVWIPFNVGNDLSTGFKAMLREKVKAAAFVDVGGLYDPINVKPGMRTGTGVGLRFIYNPIIFKFDFGYGFGDKATGGARGKFHFGITSNLPF